MLLSAKSGEGSDVLAAEIERRFTDGELDLRYDAVISDARQFSAVSRAIEGMDSVLSALRCGTALDLCCIDAEAAMRELGEINGRNVSEDIVTSIFSRFCVGK